ncbi:hypothetical protein ACN28I_02535 [Archangium gephyra]|uniref:hypothetical protein n=1 Tax=Archangium gephyra TaxID=48 RepID=UPI003B7E9C31
MSNNDPLLLDDSLWPLLIVQIRGAVPFARFEEYLVQRLAYLERQQKHVMLIDLRHAPMLPSEHRRLQSEWLKQHEHQLDAVVLGHAIVITSPLVRLMLSTFQKARPRSGLHLVTPRLDDAARWCLEVLEEAGCNPPTERIKARFGLTPH